MGQIRTKVYGPPGTGKTTHCLNLLVEALKQGQSVLFVSFTRAAMLEAKRRAVATFGSLPEFLTISTIHALCMRSLGISKECLFEDFYAKREFYQNFSFGGMTNEKIAHAISNYQRVRNSGVEPDIYAMDELEQHDDPFSEAGVQGAIISYYNQWKKNTARIDFTDILQRVANGEGEIPAFDSIIIDEAQDLTPLQWQVMERVYDGSNFVYVVGDDDQSIYDFLGADVTHFLEWPCNQSIQLDITYRLPPNLLDYSLLMAKRIKYRKEKAVRSAHKYNGGIYTAQLSESMWFNNQKSSELYLVRNEYMLKQLQDILLRRGIPYSGRRSPFMLPAVQNLPTLLHWQNHTLSSVDWRILKKHLPDTFVTRIETEFPKVLDLQSDVSVPPLEKIFHRSMFTSESWWEFFLPILHPKVVSGMKLALKSVGLNKMLNPTLELSTIHGAKGKEADRVYVCGGLTSRLMNLMDTSDNEHRVFYVGITRAKNELFLVDDDTAGVESYTFPYCA